MNANDVCLISHIERDIYNLNLYTDTISLDEGRFYEKEAIRCFKSWRKNAGWLKDVNIYCLCSTRNIPSKETIDAMNGLGVTYIQDFCADSDVFSSGFLTIPYTGHFFSHNVVKESIMIRIDLDNEVIKPFPSELIEIAKDKTIVGQYDEQYDVDARKCFKAPPFDTSLIITNVKSNFYDQYYRLCFDDAVLNSSQWLKMKENEGDYWLEEYVVDYMHENHICDIMPLQHYQCGLNYPSLEFFIKNKLTSQLYMTHNHITVK